ncbi:MAG: DMT family transporter [Syntrophorhabdales bacterium]
MGLCVMYKISSPFSRDMAECDVLGIFFGLISSAVFAANTVITRRGVLRASSGYMANISIFSGCLFFIIVAALTGDLFGIARLSWRACLLWALSGIVHFAIGRTWAYRAIQVLGSNRSNVVTNLYPIATVAFAMILLHDRLTLLQTAGMVLTLSGPLLILLKEETDSAALRTKSGSYGRQLDKRALVLGFIYGFGAAVFWGSSAIFIKLALEEGGRPIGGSLIAYLAAAAVISPSVFFNRKSRRELLSESRESLQVAIWGGLSTSIAQLFRYLSLAAGSIIAVSLALRAQPLWVLILAFIFIREYESFDRWVLLGNGLVLAGTVLIIFS